MVWQVYEENGRSSCLSAASVATVMVVVVVDAHRAGLGCEEDHQVVYLAHSFTDR